LTGCFYFFIISSKGGVHNAKKEKGQKKKGHKEKENEEKEKIV